MKTKTKSGTKRPTVPKLQPKDEVETPVTPAYLTRLIFKKYGGEIHYVFVPAHHDILLEYEKGPKTPAAFMKRLYDEGLAEADVPVNNELTLD